MAVLHWTALALTLSGIASASASPKVVPMKFSRTDKSSNRGSILSKRDATAIPIDNVPDQGLYSIVASIGTPPQPMVFQLDTGSSDVWTFSPSGCSEAHCLDSQFDPTKSSSYKKLADYYPFNITYGDGTGVAGSFFTDNFDLGKGLRITNLTVGLAEKSIPPISLGIIGISFPQDEAVVSQHKNAQPYPSIMDMMVSQKLIESRSYSLWLDDLDASTGTILFGGYDPGQYVGPLTVLDLATDYQTYIVDTYENKTFNTTQVNTFTVSFSGVAINDKSGTNLISPSSFPAPAVLDSGTTLATLPASSFYPIAKYFGVYTNDSEYALGEFYVPCSVAKWNQTIDFLFGGEGGAVVQVPAYEMVLPNGDGTCMWGIQLPVGETNGILLGDTVLRSAYVIYDMDAKQLAIAQSKWESNATSSNIQAISAGTDLAAKLSGSIDDSKNPGLSPQNYSSLLAQETVTATQPLSSKPETSTIEGAVKTSLSLLPAIAEPTTTSTYHAGAAKPSGSFLGLPLAAAALPLAAAGVAALV